MFWSLALPGPSSKRGSFKCHLLVGCQAHDFANLKTEVFGQLDCQRQESAGKFPVHALVESVIGYGLSLTGSSISVDDMEILAEVNVFFNSLICGEHKTSADIPFTDDDVKKMREEQFIEKVEKLTVEEL